MINCTDNGQALAFILLSKYKDISQDKLNSKNHYDFLLIIILNMASQSSPEVAGLLSIIKSINQDRISDAVKTMTRFSQKKYQLELKNLINRFCASQNAQEEIEKLIKQNFKMEENIKKLELKIIDEKKRKANKLELEKQMVNKAKFLDYLLTNNLQKALKDANYREWRSLEGIVHDLIEYKWIKQSYPSLKTTEKHSKPILNIDFTNETKHIKKIISDAKYHLNKANQELAYQIQNLHNQCVAQIKLSPHIFSKEVRQIFHQYSIYTKQLKQNFKQQISQFREILIDLCKKRSIHAKYQQFSHTELLRLLIQSFEISHTLISTPVKVTSQQISTTSRSDPFQNCIEEFANTINTLLLTSKQEFLIFTIQKPSFKAVCDCFENIIKNLESAKEYTYHHNQILSAIANSQSSACQSLMKMNAQLKIRMPNLESITNSNFAEMALKFQSNFVQLLNQYDENKKLLVSLKAQEEGKLKQVQEKHEDVGMSQDSIEVLEPQQTDLLVQQVETLKKQLEQAYAVVALEKKNSQKLRQKVKVSKIQSSFFLLTQFPEDKKEAELQEEVNSLRLQNQRLMEALEEQRALNSNFQQRLAQALRKEQAAKTAELEKQKLRYEKLREELNESLEQISQLNKNLQDKCLFSSKRMSIYDKKQSIVDQGERKNFMSKIVQASVILSTVEDVDDPVLLQKIEELQAIIKELREMMQTKENEYRQNIKSMQNSYNRDIQDLKSQNASLNTKVKELQMRVIVDTPQNLKNSHIFPPGFIFDYADHEERIYLIENLVSYLGTIKRTRLLFRYDHLNKTNFHRYIDGQRNIVVIIKTIYGKLIAAYSEQAFVQGGTNRGFGLLLSLWARRSFRNKDQRAISYDDYYILFGNSQLRLKSQQMKVFSNFGIANGYYDNKGQKVHVILGEDKERQVQIAEYEIYALDLQD